MQPPTPRTGTASPDEDIERLIEDAVGRVSVDRLVGTARRLIETPSPTGDERYGREQVAIDELVAAARAYVVLATRLGSMPRAAIAGWPAIAGGPDPSR